MKDGTLMARLEVTSVGDGVQHSAAADLQERNEQHEKGECEKSGERVFLFQFDIHPAAGSTFAKLSLPRQITVWQSFPSAAAALVASRVRRERSRRRTRLRVRVPPPARALMLRLQHFGGRKKRVNCQEVSGSCRHCS